MVFLMRSKEPFKDAYSCYMFYIWVPTLQTIITVRNFEFEFSRQNFKERVICVTFEFNMVDFWLLQKGTLDGTEKIREIKHILLNTKKVQKGIKRLYTWLLLTRIYRVRLPDATTDDILCGIHSEKCLETAMVASCIANWTLLSRVFHGGSLTLSCSLISYILTVKLHPKPKLSMFSTLLKIIITFLKRKKKWH